MLTRGYRVVRPPWGRGSLSGGVGAACVLSVCGACLMPVRPPWGRTYICVALRPRVRCAHPRLQNSSAPLGPSSLSPFRCKIAGATPSPSPFRCKIAGATSSPPSSPQHAAVVPRSSCLCRCNASRDAAGPAIIPAACRGGTAVPIPHLYRHPAKLSAPQGSHYSITAGSPCSPAEGRTSLSCHLA